MASRSAWVQMPNGYYIRASVIWLNAEQQFDFKGSKRNLFEDTVRFTGGQFGMTAFDCYAELGVTDWLTAVGATQYQFAVCQARFRRTERDTTLSSSGLGDLWLGARARLWTDEDPVAATATFSIKIPTGSPNQSIPLGTGVVDYDLSVAAGKNFMLTETMPAYAQLTTGYRLRNAASNEFSIVAETGVNVARPLQLQFKLEDVISSADLESETLDETSVRSLIRNQSYARWLLTMVYTSSPTLDILAGYGSQISGRNALASGSFSIGFAWKN